MIKRKKRIYLISLFFITIATSIYLILWALRDNIVFFYSPTEIQQKISIKGKTSESIGFIGRQEGIAAMVSTAIQIKNTDF